MQHKQLLTWFLGFLSGSCFLLFGSCSNGPKITIYLSDPGRSGMEFYNQANGKKGFVDYSQTDKFICVNQTDFQTLLNYCEGKKNALETELEKRPEPSSVR